MPYQGGLYLADDIAPHAEQRARVDFRGKMNAYMSYLVKRDMERGGILQEIDVSEVSAWQAADRALLEVAPLALRVLHLPEAPAREAAAKELALRVVNAAMRKGASTEPSDEVAKAAEAPAAYGGAAGGKKGAKRLPTIDEVTAAAARQRAKLGK